MNLTRAERKILSELASSEKLTINYNSLMEKPIRHLRDLGFVEAGFFLAPDSRRGRYRNLWSTKITDAGRAVLQG